MAEEERPPDTDGTGESAIDSPLPEGEGQREGEEDASPRAEEPTTEERLATAEARSEALAADLETERSALQEAQDALRQAQGERDGLREQLSLAAAKYREVLLAALPEVPPELVAGQSVEEIDRSLVSARTTVDAVRRQLAGRAAALQTSRP